MRDGFFRLALHHNQDSALSSIAALQVVNSPMMQGNIPQAKWTALRDAADAYSELSDFSKREKQWLLQRVGPEAFPLAKSRFLHWQDKPKAIPGRRMGSCASRCVLPDCLHAWARM